MCSKRTSCAVSVPPVMCYQAKLKPLPLNIKLHPLVGLKLAMFANDGGACDARVRHASCDYDNSSHAPLHQVTADQSSSKPLAMARLSLELHAELAAGQLRHACLVLESMACLVPPLPYLEVPLR